MGWTLGNNGPEDSVLAGAFFSSLGRAIYIATEFERKCHYLLRMGVLVTRVEQKPNIRLPELLAPSREYKTLNPALENLRGLGKVRQEDVDILDAGRVARNFIAHEAGAVGPLWSLKTASVEKAVGALKENLMILAKADALISAWIYSIEEKEPPPMYIQDSYPDRVLSWIFGEA